MQNQKRIFYLDVARSLAIFSITLNHAVNRTYDNYVHIQEEFFSTRFSSNVLKAGLTVFSRLGVPLFLMITGALLLNRQFDSKPAVKKFYTHNYLDLLITSEIWLFLGYWFIVLTNPGNMMLSEQGIIGTIWGCVKNSLFLDQVTLGNMWYIPMILCVYLIIPVIAFFLQKFPWPKVIFIPMFLLIIISFIIPALNAYLAILGLEPIVMELNAGDLFSCYLIYIIAGWFVHKNGLRKLPSAILIIGTAVSFAICCAAQYYCYSCSNHLVSYTSPGVLLCSVLLFEVIRRFGKKLIAIENPVSYLSRISFGIFLLHLFIMETFNWHVRFTGWPRTVKLLFLEFISFAGSILIIWTLSHIPFCRKRLFLIK